MRSIRPLIITLAVVAFIIGVGFWSARRTTIPLVPPKSPPSPTVVEMEKPNGRKTPDEKSSTPETETSVGQLGKVKLSDDARSKSGDFWLEQAVYIDRPGTKAPLVDLYLALDAATATGIRVSVTGEEARLEKVGGDAPEVIAKIPLTRAWLQPFSREDDELSKRHVLGALYRAGELNVWWDDKLLFTNKAKLALTGPSAAAHNADAVHLGARRVIAPDSIAFRDPFMRDTDDSVWRPAAGRWELTALAFPERSANPFSLRCSFGNEDASNDKLFAGRQKEENFGIGVQLSVAEGTLTIIRITGGSAAARAGLQEEDTIVEVNGQDTGNNPWRLGSYLQYWAQTGRPITMKVLRAGEKNLRTFKLAGETFRWGKPLNSKPIQPVSDSSEAFILGGEAGWFDYAAEVAVKPLGSGGFGLAIAAVSPKEYVMLRWIGPPDKENAKNAQEECLQLVRVVDGKEEILEKKPARFRPYEFYRLSLDWQGEQIKAYVDGLQIFDTKIQGLKRGQVGLYALKGDPAFFDDVTVAADRSLLANGHRALASTNSIFSSEQDMEKWANPALEWIRNERNPWALHQRDFPGEQKVTLIKPNFDQLEIGLFGTNDPKESRVYVEIQNGKAKLGGTFLESKEASIGPGPYGKLVVRAYTYGTELWVDGVTVKAGAVKGDEPLPPVDFGNHKHIAIHGLKNIGTPGVANVSSSNVLDYTFESAPTDWKVLCGRWGLMNKWVCDPRWSWFGGRSETIAAVWNKNEFSGDQSIDAHVALMMMYDSPPYNRAGYERAGDYNLVLCGDGAQLDSGYSLVFGGGQNQWTRLYRNGKMVAEATEEKFRLTGDRVRNPDKPDLHQRWFHLHLEKSGNKIRFFRDGELAFEFTDPQPIEKGRVGFWTQNNGVLLSRLRIAYQDYKPGPLEDRQTALFDDGKVINQYDGEVHSSVHHVDLPPAISSALAAPGTSFQPAEADAGVEEVSKGSAWRVTDGVGGGPMALQWRRTRVDPGAMSVMRFAARIEPGVSADMYLKNVETNELYRWRISGTSSFTEGEPLVGEIPGIPADGKWHAVQFDLGPSWRAFWKRRGLPTPPAALRLMFGALEKSDYQVAGFGVNRLGSSYSVSNPVFMRPGEADNTAPKVAQVIWPFDKTGDGRTIEIQFSDLLAGQNAAKTDGSSSGVQLDSLDLKLNGVKIKDDLENLWDESKQSIRLPLAKLEPGQTYELEVTRVKDLAGNVSVKPEHFTWLCELPQGDTARFGDPAPKIWLSTQPPEREPGRISPFQSLVRSIPTEFTFPERSSVGNGWIHATLNDDARDTALIHDTDAPADAATQQSLKVATLRDGGNMRWSWTGASIDLKKFPYLDLSYKIPNEVPVNLYFRLNQDLNAGIVLTDIGEKEDGVHSRFQNNETLFAGPPAGFKDDGTWRTLTIPLLELLAKSDGFAYLPGPLAADEFVMEDVGWHGNRKGMAYWIHSMHALPAASPNELSFDWNSSGPLVSNDYASAIDEKPDTVPTEATIFARESLTQAAKRLSHPELAQDGWKYLHVRTKNATGAWSATGHYKFRVDGTPPRVKKTEPANAGTLRGQTFRVQFEEELTIEPSSILLEINGTPFRCGQSGITYDHATKTLTFDGSRISSRIFNQDGETVVVEIHGALDSAGNRMTEHHAFSFKVARSKGEAGPEIAQIRFCAPDGTRKNTPERAELMELSFALDFETTTAHVRPLRDCRMDWTNDAKTAAFGKRAVKFTALEDDADLQILLHKNAWYIDHRPQLHFDYKAEGALKLDLQAQLLGRWYTIGFLDVPAPNKKATGAMRKPALPGGGDAQDSSEEDGISAGAMSGIISDGQWHHASADLRELIERAARDLPVRIISQIRLASHGQPGTQRGAALWLDNVHMMPHVGGNGTLEWNAEDWPVGIAGYSVSVDQIADTEAPKSITDRQNFRPEGGRAGVWWIHVRAVDQAGNWGPTRHFRLEL